MNLTVKEISKDQIDSLKKLWEQLNRLHYRDSVHFKNHFKNFTFEKRSESLREKNPSNLFIRGLYDDSTPVGYIISTTEGDTGEIDSLFIEDKYRKFGYGRILVEKSFEWFKEKNCRDITVSVAEGHESVFDFYKKFGLFPRKTYLTLKTPFSEEFREITKKEKI